MKAGIGSGFIGLFLTALFFLYSGINNELSQTKTLDTILNESITHESIQMTSNSQILDFNGDLVTELYSSENRNYKKLAEFPPFVLQSFVAVEDQSFYTHPGFDVTGIARAFIVNIQTEGISQGGSTITQQFVRNVYLDHTRSYRRKITELLYSYHAEKIYSKDEILEYYLNTIYFANGAYGFESASNFYFAKNSSDLSIAETAFLVGIPNSPASYDPLSSFEAANTRKEWVLNKMLEEALITESQFEQSLEEEIVIEPYSKTDNYQEYSDYVIRYELRQLLSEKNGYSAQLLTAASPDERTLINESLDEAVADLLSSGVIIETALDPNVQNKAVQRIETQLQDESFEASAAVVHNPTFEIRAITAGKNYMKSDFHRGYQAYRSPGSTLKPLLVYAPYLEMTDNNRMSLIDASPFSKDGYSPKNFNDAVYERVTMEEAFIRSHNTPAVRMLDQVGIDNAFSFLDAFEFQNISEEDKRLPAALGGLTRGVSVLELTNAYSSFSKKGEYKNPRAIRQITDQAGNVLYTWADQEKQIWSEETTVEMRKLLSGVVEDGTGRRANFESSKYVGGKTGTSDNYRDLWFVGLTDQYTIGLWVGYDSPQSLENESSANIHTTLWRNIASSLE